MSTEAATDENSASATPATGPMTLLSQLGHTVRYLLHPESIQFNLTVAALAGVITTVFAVIVLLIVLVATNFNLLGAIE